jgi:hypothetical protein
MNTIKWNSDKTSFTIVNSKGVKEVYNDTPTSTTSIKVNGKKYWLVKK